jgi:glutathione S-transferase
VITLFGPRNAPFVEKVILALGLKKLSYELREPQSPDDYRRLSPKTGKLPVLDIDGERVDDSTAILLWLDERFPEPPLLSPEPRTAAAQRQLEDWADESFYFYWTRWLHIRPEGPPSAPLIAVSQSAAGSQPGEPAEPPRPEGVSLRSWIARRVRREPQAGDPEAQRLVYEICHRVDDMARLLGSRPFYYADTISMADLAVYAMLQSLAQGVIPGVRAHLEGHAVLVDFMTRVAEATRGEVTRA